MIALALIPLMLAGQTHSNWEASVRTEVRARTATPQDRGPTAAADVELRPRLSGSIFNGPWTLAGSYSPTLRSREPYVGDRQGPIGDHSHVVQLGGVWAKEGTARAFLTEYFNYGTLDLSSLARETGTTMTPVPAVRGIGLVTDLTTDTSAGIDLYLTQRLTLGFVGGFVYGGGVDAISRRSLPLQSTYRVGSRLSWLATKLDTLALSFAGQYIRFFQVPGYVDADGTVVRNNPGARIFVFELALSYTRQLAEQTTVDLSAGLTGSFGQIPNVQPGATTAFQNADGFGPLVSAGFNHREQLRAQTFNFRLNASLAPFVDRYAGTVYSRVEGGGSIGWTNAHHVSAAISAGVARSLPVGTEAPLTSVYSEAGVGYQGDPWWRVDLTGRLSYTRSPSRLDPMGMGTPATDDTSWVVGVSFTLIAASEQPRTAAPAEQ